MAIIPSTLNTGLSAEQVTEAFDNALTHVPGTSTPAMDGTGAAGTAETFSRSDHVHPSDTSKQNAISSDAPIASECVSPMTGYSKSSSSTPGAISTSDTLNAAIGKLEKRTDLNENNISSSFTMVAHTSANGTTSLSYDTNINDFNIGGANSDKSSGSYLIICTNWSTTPAPYVGLLTFSGATGNKFEKTDIVTGFTPTIKTTQNVANATIDISGAAKISIYATK